MTVNKTLWIALSLVSTSAWANPAPVTELGRNATINQQQQRSIAGSGTLEQRLATLERVVEARAQGQIQMQQQLHILLDEVSQLRGVTETHAYQLEEMLQRQRDLYQEIDRRVGALQTNPATPPAVSSNVNDVPTVSYSSNMSENDAYDKAVNMVLKDRRYDAAIPEFAAFLKNYPDSAYAPNAHYWLGQLLFNNNELAKAKTHFERVVANYATSNKVPDALLKLGQVAERENNKDAALRFYRQLTSQHGSATSARLAQERIDALK